MDAKHLYIYIIYIYIYIYLYQYHYVYVFHLFLSFLKQKQIIQLYLKKRCMLIINNYCNREKFKDESTMIISNTTTQK